MKKILKVMIAFPSDVAEDAEAVDVVLSELNKSSADLLGVRFEAFRWDRDCTPGIGRDPQDVINAQIADKFDLLVAIFWTRIGSPTPRAQSGAIEEIQIAMDRMRSDANCARLLVYFKTANPDLERIDPTQLAAVRELRSWLSAAGVLFKTFDDVETLKTLLRVNLTTTAKDLVSSSSEKGSEPSAPQTHALAAASSSDSDDDFGLLDYLDIHESRMAVAIAAMGGITAALNTLQQSMERRTGEINELNSSKRMNRAELRRLLQRSADDWDEASRRITTFLTELSRANADSFHALSCAVPMMSTSTEQASKQRLELAEKLDGTVDTFSGAIKSNNTFRSIVASFPRMTVEHNRAKKKLVAVLDGVETQFTATKTLAADIAVALRTI